MTKETYESQISRLEEADSDYSTTVSRWSAESIANDADIEIKKLKELLKEAQTQLFATVGCPKGLVDRIDEVLEA